MKRHPAIASRKRAGDGIVVAVAALLAISGELASAQSTFLGASANWSDSGNWSTAPAWTSTTDLVFAATSSLTNAAFATNTNNVSSGTFRNLTFNGGPYTLGGNAMTVTGTLANAATGTNTINFDLNLAPAANVVWTATTNSTTVFGGSLSGLSGRQIQLVNSGSNATAVHTWVLAGNNSSLSGTIWVAVNNAPNGSASGQLLRLGVTNDNAVGNGRVKLGNQSGLFNMSPTNAALTLSNATVELSSSGTFDPGAGLTVGTILQNVASSQNTTYRRLNIAPGILSTSQISTGGVGSAGLGIASGTVAITGSSPNFNGIWYQAGGDTIISNAQAFGSGTIGSWGTTNSLSATQPLTLTNVLAFDNTNDNNARDFGFSGTNSIAFDGNIVHLNGQGKPTQMRFNNTGGSLMTFNGSFASTGTQSVTLTLTGSLGNARFNGPITNASGSAGFVQNVTKSGNSTVTFGTANTYSGTTVLNGGLLRLENATALPGGIGSSGGTGWLNMHSTAATAPVVLGLGSGNDNFERALGAGAGQVVITGSGGGAGFAAFGSGSTRNVNLGGASAAVTWGENNFMSLRTGTFILGHAAADGTLDFKNPLATGTGGGTTRTISVAGQANVDARLSGAISGTHGLLIVGGGMLSLTGTNSFDKALQVTDGGVEVGWLAATGQNSPIGTSGSITLGGGATAGTFRWVGASATTSRSFYLGGTAAGGNATIDASGQGLLRIDSTITAADGTKTLTLTGTNTDLNQIGVIQGPGSGALTVVKEGPGRWRLTGTSTFTGGFSINSGTIVAAANAGTQSSSGVFGFNSPSVGGTAANLSGTVALLAEAGFAMQTVTVTGTGVGSTQAVLIGGANTTGTAMFADSQQLWLGRNVSLVATGGGVAKFGSVWKDGAGGDSVTADVAIGAPGYDGTVRFTNTSVLVTQGAVAVRNGTAVIDSGATLDGAGTTIIDQGATLGGAGVVAGPLGGAGLVAPGNSPGILTAEAFDPAGGLDITFEFTDAMPTYTNSGSSVNDILRLTGASPFLGQSLDADNVVTLYLPAIAGSGSGSFTGGFFTDITSGSFGGFLSTIASGSYVAYYLDPAGSVPYNGSQYSPLPGTYQVQVGTTTVSGTTAFQNGGSAVNGQVSTFTVVVPEPASVFLAGIGIALAGWAIRRRTL